MQNLDAQTVSSIFTSAIGRPPSSEELDAWINKIKYDPNASNQDGINWAKSALTDILTGTKSAIDSRSNGTPTTSSSTTTNAGTTTGTNYTPTTYSGVTPYVPPGQSYSPVPQAVLPTSNYSALPFSSPGAINLKGENGFPSFSFDFAAEQASAYNELKPFYEKLLSFAGGDLDLAKRIIDYTYQQGMRESRAEFEDTKREQALTFPVEQSQLQTTQNKRGILTSGFGLTEKGRLGESQALRKEAAERALADRESRLMAQKGFDTEDKSRTYDKTSFDLERERRKEASTMAQDKFSIKSTQYQGELSAAQRAEDRRVRDEQTALTKKIYQQQGYSV